MEELITDRYVLAIFGVVCSIIGFYLKRLYEKVDQHGVDIKEVTTGLHNHRVEDASTYVSRQELDARFHELRDDIRGMISPLNAQLQSMSNFLREHNK
jgi:hypothetical protein